MSLNVSLYESSNNLAFNFVQSLTQSATLGYAVTALGNTTRWPTWDSVNTVTVQMTNGGTLASAANDLAVLNGGNAALLGSEIIQYVNVVDNGGGSYTLSRLLRGRNGTNLHVGSHVAGERFIVLTAASLYRVPIDVGQVGKTLYFKAVTAGAVIARVPATPLAFAGNALKPYSPCSVKGTRDGSNNLTITWIRRTRINGAWRDLVDVTLGEMAESYSLDVMNGSTVVRTLTASTGSVVYSAAQQTTDFGGVQLSLTVKVYQLSALVGRGFPATETI